VTTPWITAFVILSGVVVVNTLALIGVLRRGLHVLEEAYQTLNQDAMHSRITSVRPGTRIPEFTVRSGDGAEVSSKTIFQEPAVLVFVDGDCKPCEALLNDLRTRRNNDKTPIVVVSASVSIRADLPVPLFYQAERAASRALESNAMPHAFAIAAGGLVLESAVPSSLDDLHGLAERWEEVMGKHHSAEQFDGRRSQRRMAS
jgi:hypothetical protein